ncbi:hypothetical protein H1R20_g2260, partial [Candolleomyces eurysporus]
MSSSSSLSNHSLERDDEVAFPERDYYQWPFGGTADISKGVGKAEEQKSRVRGLCSAFFRVIVALCALLTLATCGETFRDLRILAISTHITELSYAISDIQTRIFEIQELRHKSQAQNGSEPNSPSNTANNVTSTIDQSLMALDERLENVEKGIKSVNENIQPYCPSTTATPVTATQSSVNAVTPTTTNISGVRSNAANETTSALLRKHATLIQEWESVQDESDVLREELKEDKWLTVFRTVTDQADGMMSSLEKAVNRCQDFIFQVHQLKRNGLNGADDLFGSTAVKGTGPVTLDTFTSLLESYEAKKNPTLVTPLSVKKKVKGPYSEPRPAPSSATSSNFNTITPSGRKQRASLFPGAKNQEPVTPERPGHKYSQSVTPEPSPRVFKPDDSSGGNMKSYAGAPSTSTFGKSRTSLAPAGLPPSLAGRPSWNSSTKVEISDEKRITGTIRGTPSRPPSRPPSSTGMYRSTNGDPPPVPPIANGTPYRRSLSRASMTSSSRPWSPFAATILSVYRAECLELEIYAIETTLTTSFKGSDPFKNVQYRFECIRNSTAKTQDSITHSRTLGEICVRGDES